MSAQIPRLQTNQMRIKSESSWEMSADKDITHLFCLLLVVIFRPHLALLHVYGSLCCDLLLLLLLNTGDL